MFFVMNKKLINSFLLGSALVLSAGAFVGCKDYESDIDDLNERVAAVEKVSKELQDLIQKGSVITNVESTSNGVRVTLSDGKTFDLTNGTNGADGAAGKDGKAGSVVTIGEDGYWYIDGVKTAYKAQGEKGEKGDKGDTGAKGDSGDAGTSTSVYYYPGTEGAEDGYWVKVENGVKTVTTIKWASADSDRIVAIWSDGKLILRNVTGYNGDITIDLNVYLKALVYKPEMVLDGQNAMEYIYFPYKPVVIGKEDTDNKFAQMRHTAEGWSNVKNTYSVGATTSHSDKVTYLNPTFDQKYSLDPSNAIVPDYVKTHLGTISQDPDFLKTRAASVHYTAGPAKAAPKATYLDVEDGVLHVGITMSGKDVMTQEENSPYNLFDFYTHKKNDAKITDLAVIAPLGEGQDTITSTWASVYASQKVVESLAYTKFAQQYTYANPEVQYSRWSWDKSKSVYVQDTTAKGYLLGLGLDRHKTPVEGGWHLYHNVHDAAQMVATLELAYDSKEGINLNKLVEADVVCNSRRSWNADYPITAHTESELNSLGMKFNFVQVPFAIGENGTEQTQNHSILEKRADGTYIVACGVLSESDTDPLKCKADESKKGSSRASVGRTPLIRVELCDTVNNQIVEEGYIKFVIVEPEKPIITEAFDLGYFYYKCTIEDRKITWHAIEQKVLDEATDMSKETFNLLYESVKYGPITLSTATETKAEELAQWVPTGKKDIYGQPTFTLADKHIGHFYEVKNVDSETTNILGVEISRADYVNCVNDPTYPVVAETRYVKFVPKAGLGNTNFNRRPVFVPINLTFAYPKSVMANKIPKYWYADNSFNPANDVLDKAQLKNIHGNVEAPSNETDVKSANADFNIYLDERFANTAVGHAHNAQWNTTPTKWNPANPTEWKPSYFCFYDAANACNNKTENAPSFTLDSAWTWNTAKNFPSFVQSELVYVYYFTKANNNRKVKGASGTAYTLTVNYTVDNNPVMLYSDTAKDLDAKATSEFEYRNTALYANKVKIAEIQYQHKATTYGADASREHEAKLVFNVGDDKALAIVKDLINVPAGKASLDINDTENVVKFFDETFDLNLGVATFNEECGAYLPLSDNTFNVEFLKPVYVEPLGPAKFNDAVDGGTKVYLYDLLKFYDWRASKGDNDAYEFKKHTATDLYKYYNVDLITVNPEEIKTNLSGEFKTLKEYSNGVEFQVYDGCTSNRIDNGKVVNPDHKCTAGKKAANYDYLWYSNNTGTHVTFDIEIPVRIHHKWSQKDLIVWVKGTVNRTAGN